MIEAGLMILGGMALAAGSISLGYWMGRNSAERPLVSDAMRHDPGPVADEEDIFREAMSGPEPKSYPTIQE